MRILNRGPGTAWTLMAREMKMAVKAAGALSTYRPDSPGICWLTCLWFNACGRRC